MTAGLVFVLLVQAAAEPAAEMPSDEELAQGEHSTYIITDTAPSGPGSPGKRFDPDTEVRVTQEQLRERGITNLADALLLVPELLERPSGRGEVRVDVRGARKGDVMILVDGVAINEPFYGVFDVASIPVTDIAEIRVSLSPASPLDGPGGGGGVIEVVTLPATGPKRVQAHLEGSNAPGGLASVTGRAEALPGLALRVSGGGTVSRRDFEVVMGDGSHRLLGEGADGGHAALRAEYKLSRGMLMADAWFEHRSFLSPPGADGTLQVQQIDGETALNGAVGGSWSAGGWRLEGRGFVQKLDRDLRDYSDATLATVSGRESIRSDREGLLLRTNRFLGHTAEVAITGNLETEHATDADDLGNVGGGRSTLAEVATGLLWTPGATVRIQTAAGVFLPLDDPASPWPEAKLVASFLPAPWLEARLTGARKGRTPTIRERYQIGVGNPELRPEMSTFGELALAFRPRPWFLLRAAGYVRQTDDLIRFNDARTLQVNYGDVLVRGVEGTLEVGRGRALSGGGSYQFADQGAPAPGQMAVGLENFPQHKGEVWMEGRYRGQLGVWSRWRYVGERSDQGLELAAYSELDFAAWAGLHRDLRAAVRIENATDERYLIRVGEYSLGRTLILSLDGIWE
jgi:outer membrane receptor protein involved in Fe transport